VGRNDLTEIYGLVCRLNGTEPKPVSDIGSAIARGLQELEKRQKKQLIAERKNAARMDSILEVVMSLVDLDYTKKAVVSGKNDSTDRLGRGINMLREVLISSTLSLKEKEVLLKEVHHRVKNNLQVISSLLNLQTEYFTDKDSLEKFNESRNRIKSMSLVHEKLYKSKDLSRIDFKEYVNELVLSVSSSYNTNESRVKTKVLFDLKTKLFDIDMAIPCGLIINELLSNCYKHAFPYTKKGEVIVSFSSPKTAGANYCLLKIEDNGIGMKKNTDFNNSPTLGLQLVSVLVEQIGGKLEILDQKGTGISVLFQIP
jgi:two-component sensor histidine kinase